MPQVGEVILGQGDGEVEEVVPGVRDDDGHAPGLTLTRCQLRCHGHLKRRSSVPIVVMLNNIQNLTEGRSRGGSFMSLTVILRSGNIRVRTLIIGGIEPWSCEQLLGCVDQ